ncbi:hypothetical protein [Chania multitudinisentens]|uniref:hypothetical protein n=1 Tax=Chania multitudinisentens TaxID=1639108 RepID=UPI0004B2CC35|nr:hypothetical protein [Chania multitudinisentens]
MAGTTVVKENTYDSMVRFGLRLAWFNLLGLVIIFLLASVLPEEGAEWIDISLSIIVFINITTNLLVFCFASVGLFKSTLKWSALLAIFITIIILLVYIIATVLNMQTY